MTLVAENIRSNGIVLSGDEKALYVTLSESKHELLGVAHSHGWSLDGIPIFEMAPQVEEDWGE